MRSKQKIINSGEERVVTFFAWFPITLLSVDEKFFETRWLQRVTVRQKFHVSQLDEGWNNVKFEDSI